LGEVLRQRLVAQLIGEKAERELALQQQPPPPGEDAEAGSEYGERRTSGSPDELGEAIREATEAVFLREVEGPLLASVNGDAPP